MKKTMIAASLAVLAVGSLAQPSPRGPMVNPPAPQDESNDARIIRRAIMRDTLGRQFTAPEMEQYRNAIDAYERAKSGIYSESAKVTRRRISVGLNPDADIPELRLNAETVGAVVFTDSVGNPWNVEEVIVPGFITAQRTGNMVILKPAVNTGGGPQAPQRYGRGSVTVVLEGLKSTIPFQLSYGLSREVDGQLEAQIQARNPNAVVNAVQGGVVETDEAFGLFLDGEPPRDAQKVRTSLRSVDAWMYRGALYLRTALAVHSPAFKMFGGSASGMSVYRFDRAPSIVNAIRDGEIVTVGIGD